MTATKTPPVHGSYLMPTIEHATVADAMHPGIMSCEPDATATEIARMMATHHVHCIATMGVSHEQGERLVWGLISDLDVLKAGLERSELPARALASEPIVTVEPTTPLLEAAALMLKHGASHLVVIDPRDQRPIGMLSTLDVAGTLAWGEA